MNFRAPITKIIQQLFSFPKWVNGFVVALLISSHSFAFKIPDQLSLNGRWDIIFDSKNEGKTNKWYLNAIFEQNQLKKQIEVPSCWEEFEKNYEGVGIYRKKFNIPEDWKSKIIELNFGASNYMTEIWLNDQVVGFHEGGYTPFSFRIDRLLKTGAENTLIVRVVGPIILTDQIIDGIGRQEVPMWRGAITGGIWQSVSLSVKGFTKINDVFIEPNIQTSSSFFNLEIENLKTEKKISEISVQIFSADGKEVTKKADKTTITPGKNKLRWELNMPDAKYWSVERPYLYKVKVEVKTDNQISDSWESKFGMREFTIKNKQFYLNGSPLYLKAAFHEGLYPVKLAYPDSKEMAIKEIKLAKEAGFNMIRPWRKPAPPMWLDLCDSLGVLTVGSPAVECMGRPISTPRLPFVVENEIRKTILSNRNRTCIVQWELFNEINRPIMSQMLNSMSMLARELDPTRLILDESGGWAEGAKMYLPYEYSPTEFNDIHHYSGSQVTEREYNAYLATAKTKEQLKVLGLETMKGVGKNIVPGKMSYVSELGYGSSPDFVQNNKEFKTIGNPIVAPTIYHKALNEGTINILKKTGFDIIYPNVQDFYLEQQKMHGIANKRMIEATRSNPDIQGYCVHALVDGDWVIGAGLLDLWRNPKSLVYSMTKEATQQQIAPIRILPRNVYASKGTKIDITGINELADEQVNVTIKIVSTKGKIEKSFKVNHQLRNGISSIFTHELNTEKLVGTYDVTVEIKNIAGKIITTNCQSFDVFSAKQLSVLKTKIAVVDIDNKLTGFLKSGNVEVVSFDTQTDISTPVFVGKAFLKNLTYKKQVESVTEFVKKGGYAVFLEVPGSEINIFEVMQGGVVKNEVETDVLPFGAQLHSKWSTLGGWAARSHIVSKHPVFKGLPVNQIMHGVYENVHPLTSMSKQKGKYIAGLIGYDHYPNNDDMVRHYNGPGEVWWAADVLETPLEKGTMLLSTMNILPNLGKDPVADKLLYNLIEYTSSKK